MNKSIIPFCIAFVFGLFITTGCKKDSSGSSDGISAIINGSSWQTPLVAGIKLDINNVIALAGFYKKGNDSSQMEIDILDSIHVNQPDLFYFSDVRYYLGDGTNYDAQPSYGSHGSLTVTSWDTTAHRIAGTFEGVFYNTDNSHDSITVTDGKFNTKYQVQ